MSGGVDSSVTAHLLREKGYEVQGISFLMWESVRADAPECCSLRATDEASETARHIDIPHRLVDVREDFREKVVKPFVEAYLSGLTPNPCILCNRFIKFPYLMHEALEQDAEYIATGHYARVEKIEASKSKIHDAERDVFLLKKGVEPKKDQSYVLYVLTRDILKKLILPLGNYRKDDVREVAKELRLPAAERSESQEICFVEEKNYLAFVKNFSPVQGKPGNIIDTLGNIIGIHKGIYGYTIGQRKGLGVSYPEPLYVIDIDVLKNTIYVGPREAAKKKDFFVEEVNWIIMPSAPEFRASAKVRSTMKEEPATIRIVLCGKDHEASRVHVTFDEPQWAPAPGQSAVFYDGDSVVGGGVIKRSV